MQKLHSQTPTVLQRKTLIPLKKQQNPDITAQLLFRYQRLPIKATLGDLIAK